MGEAETKIWNQKELNKLLEEVLTEAVSLGIPYSKNIYPKVVINKRAKSRFGCCKKIKRGVKTTYEIELSYRLITSDKKRIKQTLAHEVLHTCPGCDNHGSIWKAYAKIWNAAYQYEIKRTGTPEEFGLEKCLSNPLRENYIVICKNCGAKIARARLSPVIKYPHHYRCKCGGKLERVK